MINITIKAPTKESLFLNISEDSKLGPLEEHAELNDGLNSDDN